MMTARQIVALALVLVVLGVGLTRCAHDRRQRDIGAVTAQLDASKQRERDLARGLATATAQYRVDTVRLRTVRERTDTLLARVTDTVLHVDTVRVIVAQERLACSLALVTCEQRGAVAESLAVQRARRITLLEQRQGLMRRRFTDRIGVFGGYGLTASPGGAITHGAQVGLGVRLWP